MTASAIALLAALSFGATGDVSRLRPPPAPNELMGMQIGAPLAPWQYALGVTASYASNPVVWRYSDGSYDPVVTSQVMLDVGLALGLMQNFDIGVVLPVAVVQQGVSTSISGLPSERLSLEGAGLGDLRLVPRVAFTHSASTGVDLALAAEVTAPTGDSDRFRGETTVTVTPRLIATVPMVLAEREFATTLSAGMRLRPTTAVADVELGHELEARVGASLALSTKVPLSALAEIGATTSAREPFSSGGVSAAEVLAGLRLGVGSALLTLGGGVGLSEGLGTPRYRVLLAIGHAPPVRDTDHDGIPDIVDSCPTEPEDLDGDKDSDGCPESDPKESEDDYDYEYKEIDCPDLPSGVSTVIGPDGCPLADTDQDGVPDINDKCPKEKETINGIADDDGCPDSGEGKTIYIPKERIEIRATILFETGKATIKRESMPVLDEVAMQILAHPEVRRVRVEGHTDSVGPDDFNLYLSQDRADAVRRYIMKKGVAKDRVVAEGFGETRPIASNSTAQGKARNRRVEFVILE